MLLIYTRILRDACYGLNFPLNCNETPASYSLCCKPPNSFFRFLGYIHNDTLLFTHLIILGEKHDF